MPLNYPGFEDFNNIIIAEYRKQISTIDPTVPGNWATAFAKGNAAAATALTLVIRDLEKQLFPPTAEGSFLDLWGEYENIPRPPATSASGNISLPGTNGTVISSATLFKGSNGLDYTSTSVSTISINTQAISSITRVGTIATVTTTADHTLATGLDITISGANETDYNGTFSVTVIARDQFTYVVSGSPSTPATGTISLMGTYANVSIAASDTGVETNIANGGLLTLDTPISGADSQGIAQFDGLSGGSSVATDAEYYELIFISRSDISGVFTNPQIEIAVKSISGNTRVFIKNPTIGGAGGYLDPLPGQVSIFFLRDNDVSIIPTASKITETKQAIIDNGKMPGHTSEDDIFVQAPALVATDFIFSSISPDTTTMRNSIGASLIAFFEDSIEFETDVTKNSYNGAIQNTVDQTTGDPLISFSLSAPTLDITISSGEIAALGAVTFP
jgi:uncharacterized phage protein gp47/JayE